MVCFVCPFIKKALYLGSLTLSMASVTVRDSRGELMTPTSVCVTMCARCVGSAVFLRRAPPQYADDRAPEVSSVDAQALVHPPREDKSTVYKSKFYCAAIFTEDTFSDIFTLVLCALAGLGLLTCIVCMCYFQHSMQACGYLLITGTFATLAFKHMCFSRPCLRLCNIYHLRATVESCHLRRASHRYWRRLDAPLCAVRGSGENWR